MEKLAAQVEWFVAISRLCQRKYMNEFRCLSDNIRGNNAVTVVDIISVETCCQFKLFTVTKQIRACERILINSDIPACTCFSLITTLGVALSFLPLRLSLLKIPFDDSLSGLTVKNTGVPAKTVSVFMRASLITW